MLWQGNVAGTEETCPNTVRWEGSQSLSFPGRRTIPQRMVPPFPSLSSAGRIPEEARAEETREVEEGERIAFGSPPSLKRYGRFSTSYIYDCLMSRTLHLVTTNSVARVPHTTTTSASKSCHVTGWRELLRFGEVLELHDYLLFVKASFYTLWGEGGKGGWKITTSNFTRTLFRPISLIYIYIYTYEVTVFGTKALRLSD